MFLQNEGKFGILFTGRLISMLSNVRLLVSVPVLDMFKNFDKNVLVGLAGMSMLAW